MRAELGLHGSFGDDALAYCTERMDPETTRVALAAVLRQAKRNKAFENSRFIGLALDGTSAGRTYQEPRPLPQVGDDVLKAALEHPRHVNHRLQSAPNQVIHQGQIALAFPKRLFIYANLPERLCFTLRRSKPRFTARSMIP